MPGQWADTQCHLNESWAEGCGNGGDTGWPGAHAWPALRAGSQVTGLGASRAPQVAAPWQVTALHGFLFRTVSDCDCPPSPKESRFLRVFFFFFFEVEKSYCIFHNLFFFFKMTF